LIELGGCLELLGMVDKLFQTDDTIMREVREDEMAKE